MEASEPLVSVIIPTYNWSGALRFAIESVLWQTLRNFELLVIGDGCTDDSEQVTASFGDPRIRWHNLPENTGNQPAPINKGTEMARGRYIAYLGHDDLWLPDHLERLSHALEKTGGDVTYGWIELIGPEPVQIRVLCGVTASGDYEPGTSLVPTCIMHRRAMVADIGPWKDYRRVTSPPDQEFVERALKARKKFVPVKRLTALKFPATWRPNSYLDKPIGQQREYSRRIRENPDFATDELHDLTEFLIRKYPGEMARNAVARNTKAGQLIHSAREIRGLVEKPLDGDPEPSQYPPLRDWIDFSNTASEEYLWKGWSGFEGTHRWTDGKEASLIFGLENVTGLEMRIQGAPMVVPGKLNSQTVEIVCNGTKVGEWVMSEWDLRGYSIQLPGQFLRQNNVLSFKLPQAVAPLRIVKTSTDFRQLGIRLAWIEFERNDH